MLGVPGVIKTDCGFVVDGLCALTILLYRLAYPCTLKHVRLVFGLSPSRISETFNFMLHWVHCKWGFLLKLDIDRIVHLLPELAEAVHASGAPMTRVWGFVDGTVRSVARWATGGFCVYVAYLTSDKQTLASLWPQIVVQIQLLPATNLRLPSAICNQTHPTPPSSTSFFCSRFSTELCNRPTRHQRVMFNGHKRCHAFKFQGTVTPDGVIVSLYGPVEGSRRDAHMYVCMYGHHI